MPSSAVPPMLFGSSRRDVLRGVAAAGLVAAAPGRASGQGNSGAAAPKGQAIVGVAQEPTRFHALQRRTEVDETVHLNIYSVLWTVEPDGSFVPDLALEVPSVENGGISPDGLDWRVKLRPGVTWHDGASFTSRDVKFTLETLRDPNYPSGRRHGHELLAEVDATSPDEIRWRLQKPFAPYRAVLAWTQIAPHHILAGRTDPSDSSFNNNPVGTGPFRWGERRPGDFVSLVANRNYHLEGPHLERVILKYIPDAIGLKTQFITGAIDAVLIPGIAPDLVGEVERTRGVKVHYSPTQFVNILALNTGLPQFADPAVRRALYSALDKKTIYQDIYPSGTHRPTESFLPEQSWAYNPDLPAHVFDLAAARAILDEAGWKPGADGVRAKDGVRLAFDNSTVAGDHLREQVQQLLQQDWRQIGIDLRIKNAPSAALWGDFWGLSQFQSIIVGIIVPTASDPDPTNRFASWAIRARTGSGINAFQYENREVDQLLREGVEILDHEERKKRYLRIQELIRRDLPYLPLSQSRTIEGTKDKIAGYRPNLSYRNNAWNLKEWRWQS